MRRIELSGAKGRGKFLLVDDEDYKRVAARKWYDHDGYALTVQHLYVREDGSRAQMQISAHRFVMGCKVGDGVVIDHKNGQGLDCQKDNLRKTDRVGNARNTKSYGVSGYKNVSEQSANCFSAKVGSVRLGYYPTGIMAALAADRQARLVHGEFAWLNFPEVTDYSEVVPLPPRNTGERTSRTVGVSYARNRKAKDKWRAVYRKKHLGWFSTEGDAVLALGEHKCE